MSPCSSETSASSRAMRMNPSSRSTGRIVDAMKIEERMDTATLADLKSFEPDEMLTDLDQIAESKKVSLRDLYYRWERTNWSVHELGFTQDKADWDALGPDVT